MPEISMDIQKAMGMCPHGNFPSSCGACRSGRKQVEEQQKLRHDQKNDREQRETHFVRKRSGEQEIVVAGAVHTNIKEKVRPLVEEFERMDPDVVLVEGQPLESIFQGESLDDILRKNGDDVLKERQEQVYIAWLAKKRGKEVRQWEPTVREQIQDLLEMQGEDGRKKHTVEDIQAWMATYGLRKVYEIGKEPTYENLRFIVAAGLPGAEELGMRVSPEQVDAIVQHVTGHTFHEAAIRAKDPALREEDLRLVREFSDPSMNSVARDMNAIRDTHALEVIQKAKQDGFKRVFVSAGKSHVELWEGSVEEIYAT